MAKVIKAPDTSGVEGDFKQAPVGLYVLKCETVEQKTSKNDEEMLEVIFTPVKDAKGKKLKERYGRLWFYAPLDPDASWARRLKDLLTAYGIKKGGNIAKIEGKECLGRLREDTDMDGEYRPNIGKLLPYKAEDIDDEDDEDEEVDEEEVEDDEEEAEDGYAELTRAELKALIKENDLEIKVLRSMSDDDIRAAVVEQMADADDEEEDDDEDEEADEDNYDSMSLADLKQELEDRELETKGSKKVLIARLRTDDVEEPV